jgi:tetratricopeptide (TPR) repeat protein
VATVAELLERGMKLYAAGKIREAREAFQSALDLEPGNAKARSYLVRIREGTPGPTPLPGTYAAVPRGAVEAQPAAPPAAVPLPAPTSAAPPTPPVPLPAPARSTEERAQGKPLGGEPQGDEYAPSPWDDGPAAPATIELESTADGIDLQAVAEKSDLRPLVPEGARPPVAAVAGPRNDVEVWLSAAKELFSLGDFSGSLELIEKILQLDPDHGEARDYLQHNEATLVSMYESKLGPLTHIPRLAIKPEEVMWLNLDHRAGFLLAQIDGTVDFDSLFALSGLPRLDTARILANLIADGVITS